MAYVRTPYSGQSPEALQSYVQQELERIAEAFLLMEDNPIQIRNVAPTRPRNGMYYADGTNWDPGSGKGIYRYDESTGTYSYLG